eukprot:scaffold1784_cov116-Cylindrotheca_fusiformis.AAC.20
MQRQSEKVPKERISPQIEKGCYSNRVIDVIQEGISSTTTRTNSSSGGSNSARIRTTALVVDANGLRAYIQAEGTHGIEVGHGGPPWGYVFVCSVLLRSQEYSNDKEWVFIQQAGDGEGYQVAIKRLKKAVFIPALNDQLHPSQEDPYKEIHRMQTPSLADNEHVLGCIKAMEDDHFLYIVMPYCEGGDLSQVSPLQPDGEKTAELQAFLIVRKMMKILQHVHDNPHVQNSYGICHRDIKPKNFLLTANGTLLLSDFAMSFPIPNGGFVSDVGYFGTPAYLPPEIAGHKPFDARGCDLWACMVSLFILLTGMPVYSRPLPDDSLFAYCIMCKGLSNEPVDEDIRLLVEELNKEHRDLLLLRDIAERIKALSPQLRELLGNVLSLDPKTRWDRDKVLNSEWMLMNEALATDLGLIQEGRSSSSDDNNNNNTHSKSSPPNALEMTRSPPSQGQSLQPNDVVHVQLVPGKSASTAIEIPDEEAEETDLKKRKHPFQREGGNGHKICSENTTQKTRRQKTTSSLSSESEHFHCDSPIKLFATTQDLAARSDSPNDCLRRHAMTLREMVGLDARRTFLDGDKNDMVPTSGMEWAIVCNYMVDFDFLLHELPEWISIPATKLFFYGSGDPTPWRLVDEEAEFQRLNPSEHPSRPQQPTANPLRYRFFNGTHHTKLFLIRFRDRLRVIVHTANLIEEDLTQQTNGAFIQDFFLKPKRSGSSQHSINIPDFEQTLVSYMSTYGYRKARKWSTQRTSEPEMTLADQLRLFDFSTAKAVLVPSTPGYHQASKKYHQQGYLKIRQSIEEYVGSDPILKSPVYGPVVCQFSSIGSLSEKWFKTFVESLTVPSKSRKLLGTLVDAVKLVWPTVREIKSSVQGVGGGGSVPGRMKNLQKPFLRPLYCTWSCSMPRRIFKGQHVPHIKTYYQLCADDSFAWFMLGSQNLSKPAWGEVINGRYGECLRINSWELGVFLSPTTVGSKRQPVQLYPAGTTTKPAMVGNPGTIQMIPLPYNCNPEHYQEGDVPWHLGILEQTARGGTFFQN